MTQLYLIFALLLALLVAIFAVQNAERVTIDFLVWTFQTSLVIVILVSAGVGALLAALIAGWLFRRRLKAFPGRTVRTVVPAPTERRALLARMVNREL